MYFCELSTAEVPDLGEWEVPSSRKSIQARGLGELEKSELSGELKVLGTGDSWETIMLPQFLAEPWKSALEAQVASEEA